MTPDPRVTWISGTTRDCTPTHGYEPTREAAMAAFAKSWRREWPVHDEQIARWNQQRGPRVGDWCETKDGGLHRIGGVRGEEFGSPVRPGASL